MSRPVGSVEDLVEVRAAEASRRRILDDLQTRHAVLEGHFALHRGRHATNVLRFRGIGRDATALERVTSALFEKIPEQLRDAIPGAKILCPETAGFFLGESVAKAHGLPLIISQTDLRRVPTKSLLSGSIQPNDRIILVNDVAGTGASLEALRELAIGRHAFVEGILAFGVINQVDFRRYCEHLALPAHWLVTAGWRTFTPAVDCPGCKAEQPLIPVAELV